MVSLPSALDGFVRFECDEELAGRLRAEIAAAQGVGYDHFEFNLFDVELFYAQKRVKIVDIGVLDGYEDAEVTLSEFLAAIPDVPLGARWPRPPRRVVIPPPPSN